MINCWPECKCEICSKLQLYEELGSPLAPKYVDQSVKTNSSVQIQKIVQVSDEVPPHSDQDKIDYTEYDITEIDAFPYGGFGVY